MPNDLQKSVIIQVLDKIRERLDAIAKLQYEAPELKQVEEDLKWMLECEEKAPEITTMHPSESLIEKLGEFDHYLNQYAIPQPKYGFASYISTAGTVSSTDYIQHVYALRESFSNDNKIQDWAIKASDSYLALRKDQIRTTVANVRLGQLDTKLSVLHKRGVNACLSASSGIQTPVEGAALVRELLDSFKGELIRRCKEGKKSSYQSADNLALEILKPIVVGQQAVYDEIHHELSEIVKSRIVVPQSRVRELLALVEDHIFAVTISLDPNKLGFDFDI